MSTAPKKPIKYDKNSSLYINGDCISLIAYLSNKRKEKNLTKKWISNIIKNNDYWYSQIEMGQKDDCRRKFINRSDLINIVSVIIFDAKNEFDLERLSSTSENYIDNIIKVVPVDKTPREIPVYEVIKEVNQLYSPEYTNERIEGLLANLNLVIRNFYNQCNILEQTAIINFLNTFILNISTEPILSLHYYGLPFCSFFSAQPSDTHDKKDYDQTLLEKLDSLFTEYSKLLREEDLKFIQKQLANYLYNSALLMNDLLPKLTSAISNND